MDRKKIEKILDLFEHFERLKNTPRTGYTYFGIKHPESVAEHSYMVSFISMVLALLLKDEGMDIDVEKTLMMAILHESGEVLIGDLHRMARKYIGNETVEHAEEKAAEDLFSLLPDNVKKKITDVYLEFNRRESNEAVLVTSADKLELLFFAYLLEKWGHTNLEAFFEHRGNLDMIKNPLARNLVDVLFEKRRAER